MSKLGIEKSSDAVIALCKLGMKIESALEDDGKISKSEAIGIAASSAISVIKTGMNTSEIIKEYKDYDDEEREVLKQLVKKELDLIDDNLEEIIEKAISVSLSLDSLIRMFSK